jgi:hypothetical protein
MSDIFNITQCNLAQMIAESNRFLFQVLLVHIATCVIEGKKEIFSETLFKSLLITAIAIVMYHIFFRKLVEPKLEKMKMVCSRDINKRKEKINILHRQDPFRPKYRKKIDQSIRRYESRSEESKETEERSYNEKPKEKPKRSKRSRPHKQRRSESRYVEIDDYRRSDNRY